MFQVADEVNPIELDRLLHYEFDKNSDHNEHKTR